MQQLRLQIFHKTRHQADGGYQRVRPGVERQLLGMGLQEDEVTFILTDVDGSRPGPTVPRGK